MKKFLKFLVILVASLISAIQSAMLMGEKAWGLFAFSLLPFFAIYLPRKSYPWLTPKVRVTLFVILTILVAILGGFSLQRS